ncbi:hypothetical protein [Chitinilyticum litopenaei]|uniref:hypothetical protein n=1 Tax=Chitinilyticum litopenaei TaxID=1121276 RepID=UPI0004069581|nr:hypothetical protein [Chitinilyticum litopenaei]
MSFAISNELPAWRRYYRARPDEAFFAGFQQALQQAASGDVAAARAALGPVQALHDDSVGRPAEQQLRFASLLNKAYQANGLQAAKAYLQNLPPADLAVLQEAHSLAEPINVASLSEEGAANLLLPAGYGVDLDGDQFFDVGLARTGSFPPQDAPAGFVQAWEQATTGLDEGDLLQHVFTMQLSFSSINLETGRTTLRADRPSSELASYRDSVGNILAMLERDRHTLPAGQYEREAPFYRRLQALLAAA